jgi:hypothetical protein
MIHVPRSGSYLLIVACLWGLACQLRRPVTIPGRMIEPQLLEPQRLEPLRESTRQRTAVANSTLIRLLDTQARGHIGRRVLHQQPNGELIDDPVWRWSSPPDRYLDTALRLALAANPEVRLVDVGSAPALAATLLVWDLESAPTTQLVGVVEFQFTGADRSVHTQVVRASEPVSAELPGNLGTAAGSLLRRLVSEGLTRMARER